MYSIKTKLVAVITLLIVGLFTAAAILLIYEKQKELTGDIFFQSRTFGELTVDDIINDYNLYLAENSFLYFNREVSDVFQKTQNIDNLQIFNYTGELLYNYEEERERQYQGPAREATDETLLSQIQSFYPSARTLDGRTVFLKKDDDGNINYVNANENPVEPVGELERIDFFVFPVEDEFAVAYHVNYENLDALIRTDAIRIILLAVLAMAIGLILAIFISNRITRPIKKLKKSSEIIATGDFEHRVNIKTHDELEILGNSFNRMAADLDKSTKALVYKERVAKELELAKKIQNGLIPKEIPKLEGLDISAGIVPAEEIGGDVYDFLKRDENNTLFYLGDVTGHGVPSGILGSIANAMFYSHLNQPNIKEIMVEVNRVLKAKSPPNMFITLCLLNWAEDKKKLSYVNAGHEQIIRFNSSDKSVELLKGGGIALGMFPDINKMIQKQDVPIEKGDCAVLYSDGIPEAWRSEKEQYGMDRFKEAIQKYGTLKSATEIRNAILKEVSDFIGDHKRMDDITIMVIKRV
jgi:serine phosphatase RsbU (regulator of sigma subunit)